VPRLERWARSTATSRTAAAADGRVSFTFTTPGTHHYDGSFHLQNMKGVVTVH
jgi:plastocyanin